MKIDRLDHLVLTVRQLDRAVRFYTEVLGFKAVTFAGGRTALAFGRQKINLHVAGQEISPHARRATPGSADLCFITTASLASVRRRLVARRVRILAGPVPRTGARGPITSFYFRDPDGNLIEVSRYDRPARRAARSRTR